MTTKTYICEHEDCGSDVTMPFKWPVVEPGMQSPIWLCSEHAAEYGFCPMCLYFVLGSDDDRTLAHNGVCVECLDTLRYEMGEADDDWDEYDGWDYNASWNDSGSPTSELEPEDTPRDIYIGPGSEFEDGTP